MSEYCRVAKSLSSFADISSSKTSNSRLKSIIFYHLILEPNIASIIVIAVDLLLLLHKLSHFVPHKKSRFFAKAAF